MMTHLPSRSWMSSIYREAKFLPAQSTTDRKGEDHIVTFTLQCGTIGNHQNLFCLFPGQPVAQTSSPLGNIGNVCEIRRLLVPYHAVALCFPDQLSYR
jgi:hypothetical protein